MAPRRSLPSRLRDDGPVRRLVTFLGGSVVATVCSEVTLVVVYGLLHAPPAVASVLAWFAGAVPNYWLARRWTWRRRGRPSLRGELVPYAAVVLGTLLLASLCTSLADAWLRAADVSPAARVVAVAAVFLGVYVVMFGVRYVLLGKLFGRLERAEAAGSTSLSTSPSSTSSTGDDGSSVAPTPSSSGREG